MARWTSHAEDFEDLPFCLEVFHSAKELYQGLMETFAFLSEPKATTDLELIHIATYRRGAYFCHME